MLVGADSQGAIAFGADIALDFSTLSSVQIAQAAGEQAFFVMRAYPYDPDTAAVVPVFASEEGFQPRLSDNPYPGLLREALNVGTSILQADLTSALGGAPTSASVRVAVRRNEGDSDTFARFDWNNRPVQIFRGYESVPEDEWELVRTDHAVRIRIDELGYWIDMRDPSEDLKQPMQADRYAGTGEIEGDANLKDRPRPLCFGQVFNVSGVLIDRVSLVYQVNDRQIRAIVAARDKGLTEANGGIVRANGGANDIADIGIGSVWEWNPLPSQWITDLTQGLARLGSQPVGTVTFDVLGYGAPIGSSDIQFAQTIPHGDFDVLSSLDENDTGAGWFDPLAVESGGGGGGGGGGSGGSGSSSSSGDDEGLPSELDLELV